jgi:hypothetical protein
MEKEMSCTEMAQELVDKLHEKDYYSEEVLNNSMQLLKKIQEEEKELKNVDDVEEVEEEEEEEDLEDYDEMSADDMKNKLGQKGIIISISKK